MIGCNAFEGLKGCCTYLFRPTQCRHVHILLTIRTIYIFLMVLHEIGAWAMHRTLFRLVGAQGATMFSFVQFSTCHFVCSIVWRHEEKALGLTKSCSDQCPVPRNGALGLPLEVVPIDAWAQCLDFCLSTNKKPCSG